MTDTSSGSLSHPRQTNNIGIAAQLSSEAGTWRLNVAPMLDWTDKHCRFFHRLLTQRTRLYTEMVTTRALLHGSERRYLRFDEVEHPVALQLGSNVPRELAQCATVGARWGYDEINLNCGCPSDRVQRGAFGACMMAQPRLVADCVKAMVDVVALPVTVKHRIGIDREESYGFVRDFVGTVAEAGCCVFIVHARNAWLQGLNPRENREIPPLRYELVYRLKQDFPALTIVLNGGVTSSEQIRAHLRHVDGVMVGREAYHHPWMMSQWDALFWEGAARALTPDKVEAEMVKYMQREAEDDGTPWSAIARHMLGLHRGRRGAKLWRQVWSDHRLKSIPAEVVAQQAKSALVPLSAHAEGVTSA